MRCAPLLLTLFGLLGCVSDSPAPPAPASPPTGNAALIRHPLANADPDSSAAATLSFADSIHDFGTVRAGTLVRHSFTFTNTGDAPLLLTAARSSCGCTVASYPTDPIPPGGTGRVSVKFDTDNRRGRQRKPVTLSANTLPATTTIFLEGDVLTN